MPISQVLDGLTPEELVGTGQEEKADGLEVIGETKETENAERPVTPEIEEQKPADQKPISKSPAKKKN